MKNRYIFLKRLYPSCLIIMKSKDKYISFNIDKKILEDIKLNNLSKYKINHIIIDNNNNIIKNIFNPNKYLNYYLIYNITNILKNILKKLSKYTIF